MSELGRPPNLRGCRAKIEWARRHFDTFRRHADAFFALNPYVAVVRSDRGGSRYLVRIQNPPTMPGDEWALLIGDCVHNLRSALDYLVWEMAGADPQDRTTMFPIFIDAQRYREDAHERLRKVPEDVRAVIEKLQPYHTADPAKSALWALQVLDTADKHQLLTVTAVMPEQGNLRFLLPGDSTPEFEVKAFEVPLVHDAVVAELVFRQPTPHVDVRAEISADVALGESLGFGPRIGITKAFPQIIEDVERVRLYFKEAFNVADE